MSVCNNQVGWSYILGCVGISLTVSLCLFSVLLVYSWDAITGPGLKMLTLDWHPASGQFGIVPMLFGSVVVTLIALILAVPVGLLTALYISEILSDRFRIVVKSSLELLAGIPSILYGLMGVALVSTWLKHWFDLTSGRTLLTAGLLLAVMILPTLITLIEDALHNVPEQFRETARGLGLYRFEIVCHCVLPLAKADIIGAVLLALGRALGETMAVMLVIGSIDKLPRPIYNLLLPGQTLTSKLGREIEDAAFSSLHFSVLIFLALILLLMVLMITLMAHNSLISKTRRYE